MIPVNEPLLGGRELEYVADCVKSGWISSAGSYLNRFEKEWAGYCHQSHGIGVSNGTAALEIAVRALGIGPGDEVVMPTFTIVSCAFAVAQAGATPVLVDADPATWGIDVDRIEEKITPKTKAIMVVHIYGHPVDMTKVMALARKYGLPVIEDAAEVHGSMCLYTDENGDQSWRRCGSFGTVSTFSFYANKIITTGEGGMVLTSDPAIARRCQDLRNLCFRADRRFLHDELSGNYRLTNLQAAIGVAQLERIGQILELKRWLGAAYGKRLQGLDGIHLPVEKPWGKNVYWMYGLVVDEKLGITAAELASRLKESGVDTRPFFLGMHEQPAFHKMGLFKGERYPVADRLARQGLYLPSGLGITEEQIDRVVKALRESLV
jgi:perosamine synthetase